MGRRFAVLVCRLRGHDLRPYDGEMRLDAPWPPVEPLAPPSYQRCSRCGWGMSMFLFRAPA